MRGIHRSPVVSLTKASYAEFDISFDLRQNKRLSKQLWRSCNASQLQPLVAYRLGSGKTRTIFSWEIITTVTINIKQICLKALSMLCKISSSGCNKIYTVQLYDFLLYHLANCPPMVMLWNNVKLLFYVMMIQGKSLVLKYAVTSMMLCNTNAASHADISNSSSYSEFVLPKIVCFVLCLLWLKLVQLQVCGYLVGFHSDFDESTLRDSRYFSLEIC